MKTYFWIFFFSLFSFFLKANENTTMIIDSAEKAYASGNYETAAKLYEKLITEGFEAPHLYFNLGNSYFKSNKISYAILNYERAKKLSPTDEDINFNLKIANQKIIDKIDVVPQLFFNEWWDDFVNLLSEKGWSILCILLFSICLLFIALFISVKKTGWKQITFLISIVFFLISLLSLTIARKKHLVSENKTQAIIISDSVTAKGSPNEEGTKLFVIHEGTKVEITENNGEWIEIKLTNGNVGWLKNSDLIII